jgi:hypothetical protein
VEAEPYADKKVGHLRDRGPHILFVSGLARFLKLAILSSLSGESFFVCRVLLVDIPQ